MAVMTDLQSDLLARLAINIRSQLSGPQPHNDNDANVELRPECKSGNVQMAVRFVLPGELAKHAASESLKAVMHLREQDSDWDEEESPKEAIRKWLDARTEPFAALTAKRADGTVICVQCLQAFVLTVGCALTHEFGGHIVVTPSAAAYIFFTS